MEEQLISFKTAKLAKEKGFNIKCKNAFDLDEENFHTFEFENNVHTVNNADNYSTNFRIRYYRPIQSLLAKWLREVHNCFIDILPHRDGDSKNKQWKSKKDVFWTVEVDYYGKNFEIELTDESDFIQHFNNSYEEALEIGLQEALKLIK